MIEAGIANAPPQLKTPIQYLKGVGPHKAELLKKLEIDVVEDLLFHFPRTHQDRRVISFREAVIGHKHAFAVEVIDSSLKQVGKRLGQFQALVQDIHGKPPPQFTAVWFKYLSFQYDVFSSLKRDAVSGRRLFIYGLVEEGPLGFVVKVEDWHLYQPDDEKSSGLVPIYPLTEGVQDRWLRDVARFVVSSQAVHLLDLLPARVRSDQNLSPLPQAVADYHFPPDRPALDKARERLAFDEFFFLELALAMNRLTRHQSSKGYAAVLNKKFLTPFKKNLQYEFTKAQGRVINEIFRDMACPQPMNRLLQGDVGSGKTVVALCAALLALENGRQAALLAPTEILAQQHALGISSLLGSLKIDVGFLSGSTPKPQRKKILEQLKKGDLPFLIGTHALLTDDVQFRELGLVIIDEQHRFGVRQRAALLHKAKSEKAGFVEKLHPDVLCMTATPIPRTLALTLYGDLDVSTLDEKPAGRAPIQTDMKDEPSAIQALRQCTQRGEQAYVVFPLVEESEKLGRSKIMSAPCWSNLRNLKLNSQRFP
jgi:ATP-dependent DNA helicase RecG